MPASIFSASAALSDDGSGTDGSGSGGGGGGDDYPARKKFLQFLIDTLGPDSDETADEMAKLAEVYAAEGLHGEAAPLLERIIAIREKALGAAHADTAAARAQLEEVRAAAAADSGSGSGSGSDSDSGSGSEESDSDGGSGSGGSDAGSEEGPTAVVQKQKVTAFGSTLGRTLQPTGQTMAAPKPPRKQSAAPGVPRASDATPTAGSVAAADEEIAAGSTTL
jgi:hypothetical protein